MLSLSEAVRTELQYERGSGAFVYRAVHGVSATFCIGSNPHGGYMLSIAASALVKHQGGHLPACHRGAGGGAGVASEVRSTGGQRNPGSSADPTSRGAKHGQAESSPSAPRHPDMAHIRADFYKPAGPGPCQVELSVQSTTKRWTRVNFALYQYATPGDLSTERIQILSGHAMFTVLPDLPRVDELPDPNNVSVVPHTPLDQAKWCPLLEHPSEAEEKQVYGGFKFKDGVRWSTDQRVLDKQDADGRRAMQWAAWWKMLLEQDDVTSSAALLPFFADQFMNGPELLPPEYSTGRAWYPTLTFALDVKSRFPLVAIPGLPESDPARRTVGLYALTKTVHEGRHDITVEVWSAPSELGARGFKVGSDEWRRFSQLLGVSTQMALVLTRPAPATSDSGNSSPPGKL